MATGWVWDERYMWHDGRTYADWLPPEALYEPDPSPESPATKRRLKNLVDASGMARVLVEVPPRPATVEEIGYVHGAGYIERIREESAGTGGGGGGGPALGPRGRCSR